MTRQLINLLIIGLVLFIIYYAVSLITGGIILTIVAIVLVLLFVLKAVETFGLLP